MPILTRCRNCKRRARIANDSAGRTVCCSGCGATFPIPLGAGELAVEWGPFGIGRKFPLLPDQPVTLGRSRGCTIQLLAPLVSRKHAALTWSGTEWRLQDLGSSNGTFVNDQPVREIGLTDGSRMILGEFALRLNLARSRGGEPDSVLDAMALGESQAGMMAIIESPEHPPATDPLAETLYDSKAES